MNVTQLVRGSRGASRNRAPSPARESFGARALRGFSASAAIGNANRLAHPTPIPTAVRVGQNKKV